jgi:hypothetical protein
MSNYVVRTIKFVCVDESGVDFVGSDEPYWVFTARDSGGNVNTTRSKEFGDVDSGETRSFATDNNRNVIWPAKGAVKGAPGPIALSIQLWEADQGDHDAIAKQTEQLFNLGSQAPVVGEWINLVPQIVRDQISNFVGDDLMGSKTLLFSDSRLARQLPRPGAKLVQKYRFGGNSGDLPFEIAGGPDYDLYLEITRVS